MKKYRIFAIIFSLILVGCRDSGVPPVDSTEENSGTNIDGELSNAHKWDAFENITLDTTEKTTENNGKTSVSILFPSKWPDEYLDENLPKYIGGGYMYNLIVTGPSEHVDVPSEAEVVSISIYEYAEGDVDTFKNKLSGVGFSVTPKSDYSEDIIYALDNNLIDDFFRYTTENYTVQVIKNHDELGEFLQLTFIFHDRINN